MLLLLFGRILIGLFFLEVYRKKVGKVNKAKSKKVNDKTYSIINEIIKSEKDIKSLGLEEKLCEISSNNLNELKNANYKYDMTDVNIWNSRNVVVDMFGIFILFLGIYMMDIGALTLAAYILLYSYKNSMYELIWCIGQIAKDLNDVTVSSNRMFSLYNEELYKADKFGTTELDKIKGKITFKNVKFAYSDVEEGEIITNKIRHTTVVRIAFGMEQYSFCAITVRKINIIRLMIHRMVEAWV